ncbi:MAG: hypothetical protein NTW41_05370 [Verrucomicrobia bacterium]|nr:hypothetical protein [Verrucomicrobiota bacterium]
MQLIDTTMVTLSGLTLPTTLTKEDWTDIHSQLLLCKKAAAKWLQQSRDYSTDRWGMEFTADTEAQLELDLGLALPEAKPALNPADKTRAILTIEGLSMKFEMWQRKMNAEITGWDADRLHRALELLTPFEQEAKRIRSLLK